MSFVGSERRSHRKKDTTMSTITITTSKTTRTVSPGAYRTMAGQVIWAADGDQSDELDFAEAELALPRPARLPTFAGLGQVLHTPANMAAVNVATVRPMSQVSA